jgi:hypothetical protein
MMRWAIFATTLVVAGTQAVAAANQETTVVLHAHRIGGEPLNCEAWIGEFDCSPESGPQVNIAPGDNVAIFVFLRNYDDVSGLLCRFSVDRAGGSEPWGDWICFGSIFGCQPNQIGLWSPGPSSGELTTSFDCIQRGLLAPLGFMIFTAGTHGCLSMEESERYPAESGVNGCGYPPIRSEVAPQNRGRICIASGGYDACNPRPVPIEEETWGRIKMQYQNRRLPGSMSITEGQGAEWREPMCGRPSTRHSPAQGGALLTARLAP